MGNGRNVEPRDGFARANERCVRFVVGEPKNEKRRRNGKTSPVRRAFVRRDTVVRGVSLPLLKRLDAEVEVALEARNEQRYIIGVSNGENTTRQNNGYYVYISNRKFFDSTMVARVNLNPTTVIFLVTKFL